MQGSVVIWDSTEEFIGDWDHAIDAIMQAALKSCVEMVKSDGHQHMGDQSRTQFMVCCAK
jgi:hypothetical protein